MILFNGTKVQIKTHLQKSVFLRTFLPAIAELLPPLQDYAYA